MSRAAPKRCRKQILPTYKIALIHKHVQEQKYQEPMRIYWCRDCRAYHLTTRIGYQTKQNLQQVAKVLENLGYEIWCNNGVWYLWYEKAGFKTQGGSLNILLYNLVDEFPRLL